MRTGSDRGLTPTGKAPFMRPAAALRRGLVSLVTVSMLLGVVSHPAVSEYQPGMPPNIDPGTPTYSGLAEPVPAEPVAYDPSRSHLQAIFDADLAAGGDSFWFDRVLERPNVSGDTANLFTRGRTLYMYSHTPGTLGFAGGYAYRERPTGSNQNLYTITLSGLSLSETTSQRRQYPSHWSSVHAATGTTVAQKKFITQNNVAVTVLTITNTGVLPTVTTVAASSPVATTPASDGTELTGTVTARYQVTTIFPRLSGDGMTASGAALTRVLTLAPGDSVTLKVQLGAITNELPESTADYDRYRAYGADTALRTHLREYNQWWVDNVPYIDVPDANVKKMSYYRTFLNRFNYVDANIPGNDYQFPVSIEGVLGYNNAIQLTQPMHLQDLKYFRDPLWSYGNWVSSGETSKCTAFTSNPGSFSWGNTYEQYIGREAWNAYKVHGGDLEILENFAKYVECDVKGQLAKYDQRFGKNNSLVAYDWGALTGNDADAVALAYYTSSINQDRTETAFWVSGARAAAEAYGLLGDDAKAAEMTALADSMQNAILTLLWDDSPVSGGGAPEVGREPGRFGNAVRLNGTTANQYVTLPAGVVNGLTDFTIAAWVNPAAINNWARVFDFGTGQTVNMFLTVSAGSAPRFGITTSGSGGEQRLNGTSALPTNQWTHVAVTLEGTTGTLYINGVPVATNTAMTLNPSSLGSTNQNWIGRSQYADPFLNAAVDEFQIYAGALSGAEVQSLTSSAAGTTGGGDVAWYRFDEASGATALDSSGNGRNGTIVVASSGDGGKVFKQRNVSRNALVPWKDQQNFSPFAEGIVPNTDDYKLALRFFADRAEFPIMPFYTANQRDKQAAQAAGRGGSNNFSNINSTLQAQLYSRAIREYPTEYITPDMYRKLLEWLTWVQYINGDNRLPDNNEFFFSWNPVTQTLGRSGIHHNILGAYNFMIIDDIAGVRPRLDDTVELWPIDVGYDHFTVNNLSYHGRDLTVVWDKPGDGKTYYGSTPEGYSAYVDGRRAFTVDDLAHVVWDSATGAVTVLDDTGANVLFSDAVPLRTATEVSLVDNERVVDMFQKAGLDLSAETGWAANLAEGRPVSASFTTMSPSVRATAPENAVDGFTFSGLPIQIGSYVARNTIWGTQGSPNAQDWLEVDLGAPRRFNVVKLYFFSDKAYSTQQNGSGNTYRQPSAYTVQYFDGEGWVDVPGQVKSPATPLPNYNEVEFEPISAQRVRVLLTRTGTFGIGLKEIQVFDTVRDVTAPTVTIVSPQDGATYAHNETVPADYSCEDEADGSGLASCTGDVADGEPIDTATLGEHDFSVTGTDQAGNSATITHSYTVRDVTPPTVTIVSPADGAAYGLNETVPADYSCEDEAGGSGLASCTGDVADGEPIDTATVGAHDFSVTGTDEAGNSATVTHSYTVEYTFTGFRSPVENPPTVNVTTAGRVVPLKWRLTDAQGVPVTDPASFVSVTSRKSASCDLSAPSIELPDMADSSGGLQDKGDGEWQFDWKTNESWKGQCRIVSLDLADGSSHKAIFQFRP